MNFLVISDVLVNLLDIVMRSLSEVILLIIIVAIIGGLISSSTSEQQVPTDSSVKKITIGSKEFTEQLILGNIMKILLEENGFKVDDRIGLSGTMINHRALINDEIDVYMEYTGTAYIVILEKKEVVHDPQKVFEIVKKEYKEKWNLVWLDRAKFDNTNALLMNKDRAVELGIRTVSDLASFVKTHPNQLSFATNAEFFSRPDGLREMEKHYNFRFPDNNIKKMGIGITYLALTENSVDIALGFSTDGNIRKFDLMILEDDKKFFPIYNPAPVIRSEVIEMYPKVENILNQIGPRLNTTEMIEMNYGVDIDGENPERVARQWLEEEGLIGVSGLNQQSKSGSVTESPSSFVLFFFEDQISLLVVKIVEHLKVSFISVGIAVGTGLGLGIAITLFRNKAFSNGVINIAIIIVTIPSVAMFGFMVPIFGIGIIPSIIALVLYAQLPILRNTYTGLTTISSEILDAAEGIGLSKLEILFKIRFPIAFPVIMAGIRTSIVFTIGLATIAALIGAGGLGDLIFQGIQQSNTQLILVGTIPVALLAVFTDIGLKKVEDRLTPRGMI